MKSLRSKLVILFLSIFLLLLIAFGYFLTLLNQNSVEIEQTTLKTEGTSVQTAATALDATAKPSQNGSEATPNDGSGGTKNTNAVLATVASRNATLYRGMVISLIGLAILLVAGAFWIVTSVRTSVDNPLKLLNKLVQGDTSFHIPPTQDEFAGIVQAANELTENLKRSSTFAQSIGEGNFNFDFKPASEQDMLGNSLVQMREKLKNIAEADKKRNWTTEGLALFADLIRKEENLKELSDKLISELVKYTSSNQGGLFIVNRENEGDLFLELVSCYAYERKKFLTKRVDVGSGLLGQCFLEGEPILLTQIPKDYVAITSGIGSSTPTSLLLVPLKLNDSIEGVIEIASFKKFESHEVEFIQRVGEVIASAISSFRISERTKRMLEESQQQSEQMKAQEEEMRQNMEEMQATQETLERQTAELKKMQVSLEYEKGMFHVLMDFLPDRLTYKDRDSKIIRVNKAKAKRMNMTPEEFLGKTDYDFFNAEHAAKAHREEKAIVDSAQPIMNIEERIIFSNTNEVGYVSTSRIPFRNDKNEVIGLLIITKDTTQLKLAEFSLQDRDKIIHRLLSEMPVLHYKVNKDKVIYDAWAGSGKAGLPDPAHLKSKALKEVFPKIHEQLLGIKEDDNTDVTSFDTYSPNNTLFKHFIFTDSTRPGFFWVYALKAEA